MDLRSLIIGKMFKAEMLGFYNRGLQFPSVIVSNIDGSIQSVMLPVLASQQDNRPRVKDMMRRAIVTSSFVIFSHDGRTSCYSRAVSQALTN